MFRFIAIVLLSLLFQSCDDGDIIVTSFNFGDANLALCGGPETYVFYKINNDAQESISLQIEAVDSMFIKQDTLTFILDGNSNFVSYRKYDGPVTSSYFCQSTPPITPTVTLNYAGDSGTAVLTTTLLLDDNDGVPTVENSVDIMEEGMGDLDGDGIPNYYDSDDDGDNIPTAVELALDLNEDDDNNPLTTPNDFDDDGIPNYLDSDDDNDGVPTRNEDSDDEGLDPRDDTNNDNVPNYLNSDVTNSFDSEAYIQHSFDRNSDIQLLLSDLVLTNASETITQETINMGTIDNVVDDTVTFTPIFTVD